MRPNHHIRESAGDRAFSLVVLILLILFGIMMAVPMIAELAVSLSSKIASQTGSIGLVPVGFTFASWAFMIHNASLWTSVGISAASTALVVVISLLINAMMVRGRPKRLETTATSRSARYQPPRFRRGPASWTSLRGPPPKGGRGGDAEAGS